MIIYVVSWGACVLKAFKTLEAANAFIKDLSTDEQTPDHLRKQDDYAVDDIVLVD
jgi:hypothetical protein